MREARHLAIAATVNFFLAKPDDAGYYEWLDPVLVLILGYGIEDVFPWRNSSRPYPQRATVKSFNSAGFLDANADCAIGHGNTLPWPPRDYYELL